MEARDRIEIETLSRRPGVTMMRGCATSSGHAPQPYRSIPPAAMKRPEPAPDDG
jgi:hypothetical protein